MAVSTHGGTPEGAVTPTCGDCGICLCWDISRTDYIEARAFWDAWSCQDCNGSRLSAYGWICENGRPALPAAVETVVARFEEAFPETALRACVQGRSLEISTGFMRELAIHGIDADTIAVDTTGGEPHHAVRVGDFVIDWTAVQHDADAPTPLVFRHTLAWPIRRRNPIELLLADLDDQAVEALAAKILESRAKRPAA